MITDSHCHLASHRFEGEKLEELVSRANSAGVHRMVTLATCLENLESNLRIAEAPEIQAALGIHPCDVHRAPDDACEVISQKLADPRVAAVGETGLDSNLPDHSAQLRRPSAELTPVVRQRAVQPGQARTGQRRV